ncbi:MAG: hypothetical protein UU47_C0003G0027 [candidate division TM6 bacterium GW2011_GWE2_41_16]|nr:MAG: hypothetical protein UU47_C0003G0027 [candidate division TM6 bacterium GW2011_GWE2_41_16]
MHNGERHKGFFLMEYVIAFFVGAIVLSSMAYTMSRMVAQGELFLRIFRSDVFDCVTMDEVLCFFEKLKNEGFTQVQYVSDHEIVVVHSSGTKKAQGLSYEHGRLVVRSGAFSAIMHTWSGVRRMVIGRAQAFDISVNSVNRGHRGAVQFVGLNGKKFEIFFRL